MTNIYNKELSPWEKKPSYFKNVRFGYLESVQKNVEAIKEGIHIQNEAWLRSANASFVHPERIADALDFFKMDETKICEGISGINASFEWGISDVLWLIEQQRNEFKKMVRTETSPEHNTTAKLKADAQNAYSKGWFEESLKDYVKAEKREGADFGVYVSIGMIHLFHLVNKEKALEYFEKAGEWVKSRSSFYYSYALMYQGVINRDLGRFEQAEALSKAAAEKSPDFSMAHYQNALHNAILRRKDLAMQMLSKAARTDARYFLKSLKEDDFNPYQANISARIEENKVEKRKATEIAHQQMREVINEVHQLAREFNEKYRSKPIVLEKETLSVIDTGMAEFQKCLHNDSIMDYVFIDQLLKNSQFMKMVHQAHKKVFHNVMAKRKEFIRPFEQKIQEVRSRCNLFSTENTSSTGQLLIAFFYIFFGAIGALIASMISGSVPAAIGGAIAGFIIGLLIQYFIKRYGETYEIDYSVYDTYNEIEAFLGSLKKIEKKLPANPV